MQRILTVTPQAVADRLQPHLVPLDAIISQVVQLVLLVSKLAVGVALSTIMSATSTSLTGSKHQCVQTLSIALPEGVKMDLIPIFTSWSSVGVQTHVYLLPTRNVRQTGIILQVVPATRSVCGRDAGIVLVGTMCVI